MAKFIEVHLNGRPHLLNLEHVSAVSCGYKDVAEIRVTDVGTYNVDESYSEVRTMIANATGGLSPQRRGVQV